MNLFESIKSNLNESDFALDFEKNIPHCMRFKTWDIIDDPDRPKRYLYWVTQEPFDYLDIEHFRDAFVDTGFSDAYVTVRDLSSYDFNSDKDEGVLVHISKDGTIEADDYLAKANDRGWFNESEEEDNKYWELVDKYEKGDLSKEDLKAELTKLHPNDTEAVEADYDSIIGKDKDRGFNESEKLTEASGFGSIYLAEIGYNGVVGTCRGIGKTPEEAKENAFKLFKKCYPRELEDATYKALKNQGHLRDTDTEHDLWQKLNNIVPGSSGNDGTGTFVDEELMKYVDDWYGINIFDMSSGASNEGGGSLNESEKLNEGAQPFAQVGDGKYAKEVFNKLVDEATYEYGHDPYNGTISTTNFGGSTIKIADTYSEEADAKAREYIENDDNGDKWVSKCLDLGELPDQPGVHRYVFYGWAAI